MKLPVFVFALILLCSMAFAQAWSPTPMVIDAADMVQYDFDGTDLEIPFSLEGKNAKIWLVIETQLADEDKPVAVMNGFKGWHYVNGIDTTVYVSTARTYDIGSNLLFPWDGIGNEKQYEDHVTSGMVAEGNYTFYLWGYDDQSPRELVVDFIPIGSYWEHQFQHFYTHDEEGALLNAPMLAGQNPFFHSNKIDDGNGGYLIGKGDIFKWTLGNDPLDMTLLEVSKMHGFETNEVFDDNTVHYGAGIFDPRDHDTFYFVKTYWWQQVQTVLKYQFIAGGDAVQDTDWGDWENKTWFYPGPKGDYSMRSGINSLGDDTLVMLDGGQNPMSFQHDRLHAFNMDDPEDEYFDIQLDEFFMTNQPEWNGKKMESSELNHWSRGREEGQFIISGDWPCLQECIDVSRLITEEGELDPYTAEGYVVWANSNGDFFMDMSPNEDPDNPEQHWACLVSDPRNANNPREEFADADMNGFVISYTEFTGTYSFGVYCPDGSGTELAKFADDSFSAGGDNNQKKNTGEMVDYGGQFDGMYMGPAVAAEPRYGNIVYLKTCWVAFDSDTGIITNEDVAVEEEAPAAFTVAQNSPNPFNPTTTINFSLVSDGQVAVDVYNVAGQKVDTLVNDFVTAGNHSVVWEANEFAAGVYFYTVKSGDFSKTMKMTLLK